MVVAENPRTESEPSRLSLANVTLVVSLILGALYVFSAVRVLQLTGNRLVYALDDAYIHLAIAKNVALHGVWGVQASSFAPSSSSPLWTLLLAGWFRLFGVSDLAPLVLNTVLLVLCVISLGYVLSCELTERSWLFAALLTASLLGPLVPLVWLGMEHLLHILLTVLMVWQVSQLPRHYSHRRLTIVAALALLMVAARYEGLFAVAASGLLLLWRRRIAAALVVVSAGLLPVVALGLWNVANGWFFLPASILMKQTVIGPKSPLLSSMVDNIIHTEAPAAFLVLLVCAIGLAVYGMRNANDSAVHDRLLIFAGAALLHLAFAKFGQRWRYEAYLMVLGAMTISTATFAALRASGGRDPAAGAPVLAGALAIVLIFGARTLGSVGVVANTAGHIYRQQHQVARFLGRYYDGQFVAVNDIGAVNYFTQVHIEDLMGLGTLQMAKLRRAGLWDSAHINDLLRQDDARVAVIYDAWFRDDKAFQRQWQRIGEWVTDVEEEPVEGTVTFYAADNEAAARLRAALREFNPTLPPGLVSARTF